MNMLTNKDYRPKIEYNPILDTDSYKVSHHLQYPEGSSALFCYIESRGGEYDATVMFGLQYILKKYMSIRITQEMFDEAEQLITEHGLGQSFNLDGWKYIIDNYNGYMPVRISAVPEGTVVDGKNVLIAIYCDDPKAFWCATYIEDIILRVWSPITTATKSFEIKKDILAAAEKSSDDITKYTFQQFYETGIPSGVLFKLHDFGARAASSYETACLNGAAHLVNFLGTDTLSALKLIKDYYGGEKAAGMSIDASEHSTVVALGPSGELIQFERMITKFGDRPMFACVSDGFNIWNAIENIWGGELKQQVIDMNAILVIRPDSGNPAEVPIECIVRLDKHFGHTINSKGYKVLNHVRVIQGDGIDSHDVQELINRLLALGYSIDNLAFGMGGGLIQKQNRDTLKFACKNSWMLILDKGVNVCKDPITDPGKKSKEGRCTLMCRDDGSFYTATGLTDEQFADPNTHLDGKCALIPVWDTGVLLRDDLFSVIRMRAELFI